MVTRVYLDGATLEQIVTVDKRIHGYTTNPTLMRKLGITNYQDWALKAIARTTKPISFEVFADEFDEMERQAKIIASWGQEVYVKIPITNTRGESSVPLIEKLCYAGIKVNVTAVFTTAQIKAVGKFLNGPPAILSIFAGRIMDTGVSVRPMFDCARDYCLTNVKLLWASVREVYNYKQAQQVHADIITMPPEIYAKMKLLDKDLNEFSLETVKLFHDDAKASGYVL